MKSRNLILVAAMAGIVGAAAPAAADEALAKSKGCTACHDAKKKLVGPAYADVSKKHKGDAGAQATMVNSIVKGSSGKYGPVPMPPNKVTEDEAKKLAAWILTL